MISPDSKTVLISYTFKPKLLPLNCSRKDILLLERLFTWWMVSQVFHLPVPSEGSIEQILTCPLSASAWVIFTELRLFNGDSLKLFTQTEMAGIQWWRESSSPCQCYAWKKLVVKDNWHLKKTTTAVVVWKSCSLCVLAGCAHREACLGSDPGFKPMWIHSVIPPGTVATDSCPRRQSWSLSGGFPYYNV